MTDADSTSRLCAKGSGKFRLAGDRQGNRHKTMMAL
jgi:hypothetical protein